MVLLVAASPSIPVPSAKVNMAGLDQTFSRKSQDANVLTLGAQTRIYNTKTMPSFTYACKLTIAFVPITGDFIGYL